MTFRGNLLWTDLPREAPVVAGRSKFYSHRSLVEAVRRACKEGGFAVDGQRVWLSQSGNDFLAISSVVEPGVNTTRSHVRLAVGCRMDRLKRVGIRWYHCLIHEEGGGVVLRAQPRSNRQTNQLSLADWADHAVDLLALKRSEYLAEFDQLKKAPLSLQRWREVLMKRTKTRFKEPLCFSWPLAGLMEKEYRTTGGKTAWDALLSASRAASSGRRKHDARHFDRFLALYDEVRLQLKR